jgi:Sel1 repeat
VASFILDQTSDVALRFRRKIGCRGNVCRDSVATVGEPMGRIIFSLAACAAFAAASAAANDRPAALARACDLAAASTDDKARPADIAGVALSKIDAMTAIAACEAAIAAAPENPRMLFQMARAFFAAKDYDKAREFYERAAGRGDAAAQLYLADLHERGHGGAPKDDIEAARLTKLAADGGDPEAMNNLGMFYALGRGRLARNDKEAERLFMLSAATGNPDAERRPAALRGKAAAERGAAAAAEPVAAAEARKREEARTREEVALLDKRAPSRQATENGKTEPNSAEGNMTAAAGRTAPAVPQYEITRLVAMLRRQLWSCWKPPVGIAGTPAVRVRLELNLDGTLARAPVVLPAPSGESGNAQSQLLAKSALAAVRACVPLRLPVALYDIWKVVEVAFDPREMFH